MIERGRVYSSAGSLAEKRGGGRKFEGKKVGTITDFEVKERYGFTEDKDT